MFFCFFFYLLLFFGKYRVEWSLRIERHLYVIGCTAPSGWCVYNQLLLVACCSKVQLSCHNANLKMSAARNRVFVVGVGMTKVNTSVWP